MYYLKRLNKETARHLVDMAGEYSEDEYQRYVDEVGFEDWMKEFMDGEELTEREEKEINKVLKESFELSREPKLKAERKIAGLTQARMAEELGIPKRTIENWESGTRTAPEYVERLIIDKLREIDNPTQITQLMELAEALEHVQFYAYFFKEYRDRWGNGSGKTFRDEDEARAYCWKTWEAMNDSDRETYIEDPAGEFRVFAAFCEWDSELGEWVPDAGGTETEILNMLD